MAKQPIQAGVISNLFKKLGSLTSWINGILSPISSFAMQNGNVDMDESSGVVHSEINLQSIAKVTDAKGNPIEMTIALAATNVKDILSEPANKVIELDRVLTQYLAGEVELDQDSPQLDNADSAIGYFSSQILKDRGEELTSDGLLDAELPKGDSYNGKIPKVWQDLANQLNYTLTCDSPGKNTGSISNIDLTSVVQLISEYMVKVGLTEFFSEAEVNIDVGILLLPILQQIREWLIDYMQPYLDRISSNLGKIDVLNTSETADLGGESTMQSKKITVTLQKINGSTDITLLDGSYAPGEVLTDLDELLSNPEFDAVITETPQTFLVNTEDDNFDIAISETVLPTMSAESLTVLFKQAVCLYRNLYMIHWLSCGDDMMQLHTLTEDLYSELVGQVDTIGELLVELTGTIPNVYDIPTPEFEIRNYTFRDGICTLITMVQSYIDYIDVTYPNQTKDVQAMMDEWLRYWTKQLNYFLKRQF